MGHGEDSGPAGFRAEEEQGMGLGFNSITLDELEDTLNGEKSLYASLGLTSKLLPRTRRNI